MVEAELLIHLYHFFWSTRYPLRASSWRMNPPIESFV